MRELTGFDEQIFAAEAREYPVGGMVNLVARLKQDNGADVSEKTISSVRQLSLDQWETTLLSLHQTSFGDVVSAECYCDECGEGVSLVFQVSELPTDSSFESLDNVVLSGNEEISFRPMTIGDLEELEAANPDSEADRLALLLDQVTEHQRGWGSDMLSGDNKQSLLTALDVAARDLDLRLGTNCVTCGAFIETRFDVGDFVTTEIMRHAEKLLDDVHRIAITYHWTESEILSLSVSRRADYLQRIEADAIKTVIGRSVV